MNEEGKVEGQKKQEIERKQEIKRNKKNKRKKRGKAWMEGRNQAGMGEAADLQQRSRPGPQRHSCPCFSVRAMDTSLLQEGVGLGKGGHQGHHYTEPSGPPRQCTRERGLLTSPCWEMGWRQRNPSSASRRWALAPKAGLSPRPRALSVVRVTFQASLGQ
jgi:hypothetical protein